MVDPPRPEVRDENLRLIYAREEKQTIEEGLRRAKRRMFIAAVPLVLLYGATAGVFIAQSSEPSILDLIGIALVIASIAMSFVMLANLGIGVREHRRFRRYHDEHREFLDKYDRPGYGEEKEPPDAS
jgi:hypothetical protein